MRVLVKYLILAPEPVESPRVEADLLDG